MRTTCNGSPNQVPFKKFLIFCAAGRPPAYRALSSAFCNLSSAGRCGAGLDESPIGSTFMPESWLTFEFSILVPIQHSTRSVRSRCRRLAQPTTLRSPKLETYMRLCVHSLCTTVDCCGHHEAAIGLRWPRSCVRTLSDSRMSTSEDPNARRLPCQAPVSLLPFVSQLVRCALIASLMSLHLSRTAPSASTSQVYAGYSML